MRIERFTCIDKDKGKGIDMVFFLDQKGKLLHTHIDRIEKGDFKWNNPLGQLQLQ